MEPLIDDRDAIKRKLRKTTDPESRTELEGRSSAIKWILVSCFGYQGFSNAKFGRIECHEAINAFAREILLDAKTLFEENGWEIVHRIVDSLWVTPRPDSEQMPLEELCELVTDSVGIRLEHEAAYDWIAFVPQRNSDAGALTKYFGRADDGEFKFGVTLAGRWLHISQCTDSVSASPVTKMSAGVALVPLQALMRWNSLVNRSPTEIAPYWRNLQSA